MDVKKSYLNLRISIVILALLLAVIPAICSGLWWSSAKFKNKTTKKMEKIEKEMAKKNGNAFLYLITPNKGKVWTYCPNDTNHLIIYTIEKGKITYKDNIPYSKSINWLDSFNSNIGCQVYLYKYSFDPPTFRGIVQRNRILGEAYEDDNDDYCLPSLEQMVIFVDSFPEPSFYENLIRRYQKMTRTDDIPEGFEKPIDHDPFLTNLSRDICDYIFPGIAVDQ